MNLDRYVRREVQQTCEVEMENETAELEISDTTSESNFEVESSLSVEAREPLVKKKKYTRKFQEKWKEKYSWLRNKDANFCNLCHKKLSGSSTHLKRHSESEFHKKRLHAGSNTQTIKKILSNPRTDTLSSELKMIMFIIEHNLPIRLLDHLPGLVKNVCPDSQISRNLKCGRTKGTQIICEHLAVLSRNSICDILRQTFFSLIVDETTDVSTTKCLALVVRYYDVNLGSIRDRFLGLLHVEDCTANGLYMAIELFFQNNQIPFERMIGFAGDNCNAIMGNQGRLQTKLRSKIKNLFVLGCICHSMHLCSSHACHKLPSTIEDLARDIYSYFSHSSKRQDELKEFQSFINVKPHKVLKVSQTRWLSLESVVNRILEQWEALKLFFVKASLEDNLQASKCIYNALNNPIYKVYYTFLSYILNVVNKINLLFQRTKPVITTLLATIEKHYKVILGCYLKQSYIEKTEVSLINPKNIDEYLPPGEMYFGAKVELLLNTLDNQDLHMFRTRALDFYITLCSEIRKRIDFVNPVLKTLEILNPNNIFSRKNKSLVGLMLLFPNIVPENKLEIIDSEWRLLLESKSLFSTESSNMDVEEFWLNVGITKDSGELIFRNLFKFVSAILSLPHSSAACERIFSHLNLIKTKLRNHLHVNTCESILHTKELLIGKTCCNWQPEASYLNLIRKSNVVKSNLQIIEQQSDVIDDYFSNVL